MPKKRKISIAVVGCGRQAWLGYFPWIAANSHASLAAIADIDPTLLEKTAAKYHPRQTYTDWREMIDKSGADALIITTPPWIHADPAVAAAAKGMSILCEKPMASTVRDCRRMVAAADKHGVDLTIAHSLRFDPGYEKLKTLIKTGEIGRVFQLRATYDGWIPDISRSPFREIHSLGGRLRVFGTPDMGAWRMNDTRTGGGVFFDHAIHYIDLFRWLMEEEVTEASGFIQTVVESRANEDHGSSLLRFESGAAAYVQGSLCRLSARGSRDEGIIHGAAGCLKYETDQSWYVRGYPHLYNTHARVWKFGLPSFVVNRWQPVPTPYGRDLNMFKRQFDHFIDKIRGTLKPHPIIGFDWPASARSGMRNVEIVHAVYKSSRDGVMVKFRGPGPGKAKDRSS